MKFLSSHLTVTILVASVLILEGCSPAAVQETQEQPPKATAQTIEGVWQIESGEDVGPDGQSSEFAHYESLVIFTQGYYSYVVTYGEEPRQPFSDPSNPSGEEKIAAFDTITVNTGTYEATESTLITRPMAARYQSYVGGHAEWDYQIEGDTLVLKLKTEVSSDGVSYIQEGASFTRTLKRLE